MVPVCVVCLSAIFKYLCQRIYGDGSGYIKRRKGGGGSGDGQHQFPDAVSSPELRQRDSKRERVSPSSPDAPSSQLRLRCCSRAQKVNIRFSQGTGEGRAAAGLSSALRDAVWESESPARRCREPLLYNQCIIH